MKLIKKYPIGLIIYLKTIDFMIKSIVVHHYIHKYFTVFELISFGGKKKKLLDYNSYTNRNFKYLIKV
jgi:hypothetical protein